MLDYSDFTVVKNNEGMPTAMGIPIQSMLLKNNTPLFINGGGGKGNAHERWAKTPWLVPGGSSIVETGH